MTNLPQAAARAPRFFYGWVVVGVCFLAQFGGTITGTYGLAALLVPMSQDTGWSQTQIIGVNLPASITSALVSPFFGRIADRYGTRAPMTFAALLGGITIISIAWVHDLWVYYLVFGLVNGVTRPMVQVIGVSQGVAHWFVKRRALAAGIVSIAIPISGFFGVPLATALVIQFGWRGTWVVLGAILIVLVAAPTWFLWKSRPEEMGLLPDGEVTPATPAESAVVAAPKAPGRWGRFSHYRTEIEWAPSEAIKTPVFWVLAVILPIIALAGPAFTTLVVAFFRGRGLSPAAAAFASSSFVVGTFFARFMWGYLGARLHIQYCYVVLGLIATAATTLIVVAPGIRMTYVSVAFLGTAAGGLLQLQLQIWPDYFGREGIGTLRGYSAPFQILGTTLGPLFAAFVHDRTGSYDRALLLYAAISAVCVVIMLVAGGPPKYRGAAAGSASSPAPGG